MLNKEVIKASINSTKRMGIENVSNYILSKITNRNLKDSQWFLRLLRNVLANEIRSITSTNKSDSKDSYYPLQSNCSATQFEIGLVCEISKIEKAIASLEHNQKKIISLYLIGHKPKEISKIVSSRKYTLIQNISIFTSNLYKQ